MAPLTLARRILATTWVAYALVWVAMLAGRYWAPKNADLGFAMIVVEGFGVALVLVMVALMLGVVPGGRALRRRSAERTRANLLLLSLGAAGLVVQAIYVKVFWFGAL